MSEFEICKPNLASRERISHLQKVLYVHLSSNLNEYVTGWP
jgi:hypothetical protein